MILEKKIKVIIYMLLFTGALVLFSSVWTGTSQVKALQLRKTIVNVQLKWQHNAQFAGMYVAKERGLYSQSNLDVNLIERDAKSKSGIASLESGAVDFAIVSPFEFLLSYGEGKPIKAIASIYQKSPAILSSLNTLKFKNPKDLAGNVIGVSGDGLPPKMLYLILAGKYEVPINSMKFAKISNDQIGDLAAGKADVVSYYRTQGWYEAMSKGLKLNNIDPADYGALINDDIIVTTDDMIANHPEIVKKFMSATMSGWKLALRRQSDAIDYSVKYAHGDYSDHKYEEYILTQSIPLIVPSNGEKIGTMSLKTWENLYNFFTDNTIVKEFDISQAFTNKFVE